MGRFFRTIDWVDAVVIGCLSILGLFLLLSVDPSLFYQQALYLTGALVLCIVVSHVDSAVLAWAGPYGYLLSLVLLAFTYLGPQIRGASRWIFIAGIQLQPSELVKPLLILAFAWALANLPPKNVRNIFVHGVLFLIPFVLVYKQPDLGTGIVYALTWSAMMVAGGLSLWTFFLGSGVTSIFVPVVWFLLHEYQRQRIVTFLNPALDPKGAGYNALQAMIAVGSGQLIGRGLGRGTQSHLRFLPEYHTDFIFAALVEELGFFGGVLLLAGYVSLLWRILAPLLKGITRDLFPFVYSVGLFTMLLAQVFINIGMNMGIIPITGITLPLVSYGGSSLVSVGVSFAILWALRRSKRATGTIAFE